MTDGIVAEVAAMLVLGGTAWFVLDKTFRKLISNHHKTQHQLELTMIKVDQSAAETLAACSSAAAAAEAAVRSVAASMAADATSSKMPSEAWRCLDEVSARVETLCGVVDKLNEAVEVLVARSATPEPVPVVSLAHEPAVPQGVAGAGGIERLFFEEAVPPPNLVDKNVLIYGLLELDEVSALLRQAGARRIVGVDTAPHRLEQARRRLIFEDKQQAELILLVDSHRVPLSDGAFDFIYCGGDLHGAFSMRMVLEEMQRLLSPQGHVRMVLDNYDSIMVHLCLPLLLKQAVPSSTGVGHNGNGVTRDVVGASYRRPDFEELAARYGFAVREVAARISPIEMKALAYRTQVLHDESLEKEHREFVQALTFDILGRPLYRDRVAGHNLVFELLRFQG